MVPGRGGARADHLTSSRILPPISPGLIAVRVERARYTLA